MFRLMFALLWNPLIYIFQLLYLTSITIMCHPSIYEHIHLCNFFLRRVTRTQSSLNTYCVPFLNYRFYFVCIKIRFAFMNFLLWVIIFFINLNFTSAQFNMVSLAWYNSNHVLESVLLLVSDWFLQKKIMGYLYI